MNFIIMIFATATVIAGTIIVINPETGFTGLSGIFSPAARGLSAEGRIILMILLILLILSIYFP